MKLSGIVAMTPERIIGREGELPWKLSEDLKFFKRTTSGHPIVMGRRTFDSIGRPLPKRQNIVLTRDDSWSAEGVEMIHSPDELASLDLQDDHVFVIGGAQIYRAFLPILDNLLVSWVYASHEGDTRFPEFDSFFPEYEVVEQFESFEVRRYFARTIATLNSGGES
ncbi:MAG: dihydrofolate reductase [Akkermansiaceae bacterium]|jgi:dihydrofolate reductase|nr:dihydrofolate reductase [Roseibacillus sp.]|tara:strand:+ start:75 stop:572 length:498 start_codon:yes stop_codon:yes gene_type:complete